MKDCVSIALNYPVQFEGRNVSSLSLRRPIVRDFLIATKTGQDEISREINLFANLCNVSPEMIEQMDMSDYAKLQKTYADFTSGSPTPRA